MLEGQIGVELETERVWWWVWEL